MPEHYTRNTESVTAWCNVCRRETQHRVDGGRRGPCLEHEAKRALTRAQEKRREKLEQERKNPKLF